MTNKLPQPKGWKILIRKERPKEKTAGGIFLTDKARDEEDYMSITAQVVDMGDLCYRNRETGERWRCDPWCKPGDWIIIPKFTQFKLEIDDQEYRFINDDEVIAVIDDPKSIKVFN